MEPPTCPTGPFFDAALVSPLPCPLLILDRQGHILAANAAFERMADVSISATVGRRLWDLLIVPTEIDRLTGLFAHLHAAHFPFECEQHWQTANGNSRLIRWIIAAETDDGGAVRRLVASGQDVTELRAAEARFRALWAEAPIGMTVGDLGRWIVACNSAYERLTGYSEAELQAATFPLVTHPDDAVRDMDLYRQLAAGERERYEIEKRYRRKDGTIVQARLTVALLRDTLGEPHVILGMIEDVTLLRAAEGGRTEVEHQLALAEEMVAAQRRKLARYELGITDHADHVLHLLADPRLTYRQIADRLHRSPETVRDHLKKLADKLEVEARREVVLGEARARGLL